VGWGSFPHLRKDKGIPFCEYSMASCYGGNITVDGNYGDLNVTNCSLPRTTIITYNGEQVEVQLSTFSGDDEFTQGFTLMNDVIIEGKSWPFMDPYPTIEAYRGYFHSHASFAVTFCDKSRYGNDVLGCFYVKPNFPGRCGHVCNGGFITNPIYRGLGVGAFMGESFKTLAKDLGYRSSLFNLVFASNSASVNLWKRLGFTQLAVIPGAAVLNGSDGYVDAIQMFYDFYAEEK
jgi:GNAT superfamily N-acetyltransferase